MSPRLLVLPSLMLLVVVVFGGVGCTNEPNGTLSTERLPQPETKPAVAPSTSSSPNTSTSADAKTAPTIPPVKEITMVAQQFAFAPAEVTVKKGQPVRLLITSQDVTHGFLLEGATANPINVTLRPGKTTTVEFTPENVGRFIFSCSVLCGRGHNDMTGFLTVET